MSESGDPGAIEPIWDLHVIIAALRSDRVDVASYVRVLTGTLGDALPPDMVEVQYRRGLGDWVAGRPGQPVAVRVRGADRYLNLREDAGRVQAEVHAVVRDVVISRKPVAIEDWLTALAEELRTLASRDAAARVALAKLLRP